MHSVSGLAAQPGTFFAIPVAAGFAATFVARLGPIFVINRSLFPSILFR